MPIKHQADCYRVRDGLRYVNDGDVCEAPDGDLRKAAQEIAENHRACGRRAFIEKHPDGFFRVFVARTAA